MTARKKPSYLKALLDAGNRDVDTPTICGLSLVLTYVGLSIYSVTMRADHTFDMMGFGTGAAAIVGALSAHGFFRARQQDDRDDKDAQLPNGT